MRHSFTIRRKILLGLLIPAVCLAALTGFSYSNLLLIEQRIRVLSRIDNAEHGIMELRRYGKVFLFYGLEEHAMAVRSAAAAVIPLLEDIRSELLYPEPRSMADDLGLSIDLYRRSIEAVAKADAGDPNAVNALKAEAHELSMRMEEKARTLSATVRERVADISARLRAQLIASALGVFALFALLAGFIVVQVLRPLKAMEQTTRDIARGNFTPVPLGGTHDEIRDLQEAFNSMTMELKHRQEQLVQSQKLSSIGTLSAGIAHQVNNPLNNISLASQFLREKRGQSADPPEIRALENIERETGRARDIVRGLLDFARQSEFAPRRIRLKTVVNNAVRFASAQLPDGVRLEADIPDDLKLDLDPQRMSEAILNMIINATQAMDKTPGEIRLYLLPDPPEGSIVLVVEDNGKGIAPEDLPHVFDPFFTRKDAGMGTGLGLSVGYGIIEDCGGSVSVESVPGRGARFLIRLPLPAGSPEEPMAAEAGR